VQRLVPAQPHHEAAQVGDHDFGADAFQPVHAAEEANRRRIRVRAAERVGVDRQALLAERDLAQQAAFEHRAGECGQGVEFGDQFRGGHEAVIGCRYRVESASPQPGTAS
jgi:hypothetical protein